MSNPVASYRIALGDPDTPLYPHLHLLVPVTDHDIQLEVRLYLPKFPTDPSASGISALPFQTSAFSLPTPYIQLDQQQRDSLQEWGIDRLITASHPWARLGGNMLTPFVYPTTTFSQLCHTVAEAIDKVIVQ